MSVQQFKAARDFLLGKGEDYNAATAGFGWPALDRFNWALDWFDAELGAGALGSALALRILAERDESYSFTELSQSSSRVANGLRALEIERAHV